MNINSNIQQKVDLMSLNSFKIQTFSEFEKYFS